MSNSFFIQFTITGASNPRKLANTHCEKMVAEIKKDIDYRPESGLDRQQWVAASFLTELANEHGYYRGVNGSSIVWADEGKISNLETIIELLTPFLNDLFSKNKYAILTVMSQNVDCDTMIKRYEYDKINKCIKLTKERQIDCPLMYY